MNNRRIVLGGTLLLAGAGQRIAALAIDSHLLWGLNFLGFLPSAWSVVVLLSLTTYHLAEGFIKLGKTDTALSMWKEYTATSTDDSRGYIRLIETANMLHIPAADPVIAHAFAEGMRLAP